MRTAYPIVGPKGALLAGSLAAILLLLSATAVLATDTEADATEEAAATEVVSAPAQDAEAASTDTAAAPATEAATDADSADGERSVYLRQAFGWGMWPLWACSIILLALALERRSALKPSKVIDAAMIERVANHVGRLELEPARQAAAESKTVIGQAWAQGFHEFLLGGMALSEALTNATALALKPLKRNLQPLSTLGVISPLFGLLGTIVGMIIIFSQIAATGGADKGELAGGIGLALFTTAGGLIVAIPSILISRYFIARLTGLAEQAESAINRINYRYSHAVANSQQGNGKAPAAKVTETGNIAVTTAPEQATDSSAMASAAAGEQKGARG